MDSTQLSRSFPACFFAIVLAVSGSAPPHSG